MKGNTEKSHLIISTDQSANIKLDGSLIESDCEKMLVVKIDYKLNFDEYVKTLCSKANNKLRALARATPYMSVEKKKILMNSFFNAQFNYCPLIWMLHSRKNNNIIRNLHERCLRLYTITKTHLMRNYLLKMTQSLYITEIYKLWRLNFTKLKMDFCQNFLLKFLLVKQSISII